MDITVQIRGVHPNLGQRASYYPHHHCPTYAHNSRVVLQRKEDKRGGHCTCRQ